MGTEKVIVFGSMPCPDWSFLERLKPERPCVICADGGLELAREAGFVPDVYVGDGDSGGAPEAGLPCRVLPPEKDWTDLQAAFSCGYEAGGRDFVFTACTGGRQDHHLAALQLLEYAAERGCRARILDPWNEIEFLLPGERSVLCGYRYLSLIPVEKIVEGVTIRNAKYPLEDHTLHRGDSLTVSNEPVDGPVTVSFRTGAIYLIQSNNYR